MLFLSWHQGHSHREHSSHGHLPSLGTGASQSFGRTHIGRLLGVEKMRHFERLLVSKVGFWLGRVEIQCPDAPGCATKSGSNMVLFLPQCRCPTARWPRPEGHIRPLVQQLVHFLTSALAPTYLNLGFTLLIVIVCETLDANYRAMSARLRPMRCCPSTGDSNRQPGSEH